MSRLEEQDFDEKRLARRQKRKRSQLIAYISLAVVILLVVLLVTFAVISVRNLLGGVKGSEGDAPDSEVAQEASTEEIVIETT